MRRILSLLVTLAVALAVVAVVPVQAEAAGRWRAVITFDKNWRAPDRSTLEWKVLRLDGSGTWRTYEKRSWRAGSGMLGRAGTDACHKNVGWLPNGSYHATFHRDYAGNLIKGRAFRLDDMRCADGTRRVDLFIHTEQGAGNRQCADARGDQVCRWEYPTWNDYKSAGCIKLAPGDLAALAERYSHWFRPGVRYGFDRLKVRVVD